MIINFLIIIQVTMQFSIIIPIYNPSLEALRLTLDSIATQSIGDYETVIQDGLSKNQYNPIVEEYLKKGLKIELIRERDNGIYDAMNKAVKISSGNYCIFLGAGDQLHDKQVLETFNDCISKKNKDIYYGYVMEICQGKAQKLRRKLNWVYKVKFSPVCHQAVFAKRILLLENPFNTNYKVAADQDWLLKMVKNKKEIQYIDRAVAYYPRDGYSSNSNHIFLREQRQIHQSYYPLWQFIRYKWRKMTGKESNDITSV